MKPTPAHRTIAQEAQAQADRLLVQARERFGREPKAAQLLRWAAVFRGVEEILTSCSRRWPTRIATRTTTTSTKPGPPRLRL